MVHKNLSVILITIVVVVLVAGGVAGCSGNGKDRAVKFVADKGNSYCAKRGPVRDALVEDLNAELANHGAKWRVVGIACKE